MKACDYCVFIFYFLLNGFTILSLFTFSKEFFTRFSLPFHVSFYSSAFYSYYLLLTIRKDPGIVIANNYSNLAMTIVDDQNVLKINSLEETNTVRKGFSNENSVIKEDENKFNDLVNSKCDKCVINIVKIRFFSLF
jgi:hypothetical protein